jgi:uncharacterized membrane protein
VETASQILEGHSGRILIATDGLVDNLSSVQEVFSDLLATSSEIVFLPLQTENYANDVSVKNLAGAKSVWEETYFSLRMPITVPADADGMKANILVFVNGEDYLPPKEIVLSAGQNQLSIPFLAGDPGIMTIEARLETGEDEFVRNNVAYASIQILPEPKVLLITETEEDSRNFVRGLVSQGFQVEITSPESVPSSVGGLEDYQAIIIHDVLSQDLSLEQMRNIQLQVMEFGKGLIFLGGRNSYTLGGYQNTVLGQIMPVILAPPDRVQRVPITFLLVLDRSGSMAGDRDMAIAPIALTREGSMRAIETLRSDDYLGVLTFSGVHEWAVDIRAVGDGLALREAQDKVSRIAAFGGTFMYNALEEAISQLASQDTTEYPHILLMSDGVSADGSRDEFLRLVRDARRNGITISTIALGSESDPDLLAEIAENGGGRYYQVLDPADLPDVMISESRAVQAENVQEGNTNIVLNIENHPILADIGLNELPRLSAYNALQRQPDLAVEDILVSGNFNDPILSVWQIGLGHVAVWMGDIGENWALGMMDWETQGQFWSQVIHYTLASPNLGRSFVDIIEKDTSLSVQFEIASSTLQGQINPVLVLPDRENGQKAYHVPQDGPMSYKLEIEKPEIGAYAGIVQTVFNGENTVFQAPFAVNYPKEWQFPGQKAADAAIDGLVNLSGGRISSMEIELEQPFEEIDQKQFGILELLLTILVISWPLEIAIRRWQMPWRRP